jgi:hypothetical protein
LFLTDCYMIEKREGMRQEVHGKRDKRGPFEGVLWNGAKRKANGR